MHPRLDRTLGIRFSQRRQAAPCRLENVFESVIGVRFVSRHPSSFGQVVVIPLHRTRIARAARGQEKFHRLPLLCDQQMQLQSIEKPLFAGLPASPDFSLVTFGARNAVVVAGSDGKTVNAVNRASI